MVPRVIIFATLFLQYTAQEYFYSPYNVTRTSLSGVAAYRSALTLDWLDAELKKFLEIKFDFETILFFDYTAQEYFYSPYNVTRTSLSGVAAYRSALTLDWLAAEDNRQRELAAAFETEATPSLRFQASDCMAYAKPASGKVARLMLELLKNLEGDEGFLIPELIQALMRSKLLVETSMLDAEPDLEALVKTPDVMMGEPHTTFPKILAMVWIAATNPTATNKHGWCPISKVNKYLTVSRPVLIAKRLHSLDHVLARARFIMEEFIQHVTPINVYDQKNIGYVKKTRPLELTRSTRTQRRAPTRTILTEPPIGLEPLSTEYIEADLIGFGEVKLTSGTGGMETCLFLMPILLCCF